MQQGAALALQPAPTAGGAAEGPFLFVGRGTGASGTVTVQGAGAALTALGASHQQFLIGAQGGTGVLALSEGGLFQSTVTGLNRDSFILVGTQGGTGTLDLDGATLAIEAQQGNAGLRLGLLWSDTADTAGTATLVARDALVRIAGSGSNELWIGGAAGSTGIATLTDGSRVQFTGTGNNNILVGAVAREANVNGGQGALTVTGSEITGARVLLVGYNGALGDVRIDAGSVVALAGNAGNGTAFLGVGMPSDLTGTAGTGRLILDGAGTRLTLTGTSAVAEIGGDGGVGLLRVHSGAVLNLTGTGPGPDGAAELIIGARGTGFVELRGAGSQVVVSDTTASAGGLRVAGEDGTGLLLIGAGTTVQVGTLSAGGQTGSAAVVLAGGSLSATQGVSLAQNAALFGAGAITAAVELNAAGLAIGDGFDAVGFAAFTGVGTLSVTGNVIQTGGEAVFDVTGTGTDRLAVTGTLSLTGTDVDIRVDPAHLIPSQGVLLASATGGITLSNVTLTAVQGTQVLTEALLDLRVGGTELWLLPDSLVTLSGTVAIREGVVGAVSPAGTRVTLTTQQGEVLQATTDASGAFEFDLARGTAGTLSLSRPHAPLVDKQPDIVDVLALFRVVSGATPASVPDLIAADFNRDGAADITDVIDLFRFVAGAPGVDHAPRYLFIDTATDMGPPDAQFVPLPGPITLAPLGLDTTLSLSAILTGDMALPA